MHLIHDPLRALRGMLSTSLMALYVAAALCLTACGSKELNRSSAADVLEASDAFKSPVAITLQPRYRQSLALGGVDGQTTPKEEVAVKRFFESHPDLALLAYLELVEFKVSNVQYPDSASSPVTIAASLTNVGRSASSEWQQSGEGWAIPIARRELVEVTGLTGGEGEAKTAKVEYTWRWKPIGVGVSFDTSNSGYRELPESIKRSPGGASFTDALRGVGRVTFFDGSKTQKGAATLRLYDDGWRVDEKTR